MKCYYRFNTIRVYNNMINNRISTVECPYYSEDEIQKHVIQCKENMICRVEFIYNLEQKLLRVESNNISLQKIVLIINDIRTYLVCRDRELQINQIFIKIKYLFHEYAIKVWTGTNFSTERLRYYNKKLVRLYTNYYMKYQKE